MREKTPKVVITFASTSDAMAMEATARKHGIPGRIIPIPSEISAGCGLSWCADVDERDEVVNQVNAFGLAYDGVYEISLY